MREEPNDNNTLFFNQHLLSTLFPKQPQPQQSLPQKVRTTCLQQASISTHVKIHMQQVKNLSEWITKDRTIIEWDECNWHANSKEVGVEAAIKYIFVLDSLNFCFWPAKGKIEYSTLAIALKNAMLKDINSFNAEHLKNMTREKFNTWLPLPDDCVENGGWPVLDLRIQALQELGKAIEQFGEPIDWVLKHCQGSACMLTDLIAERLPMFRDEASNVCFYKRAMILVADVWAATGRNQHVKSSSPTNPNATVSFHDIDQLCMFSDYRVPQLLRERQVLVYSPELSKIIDEQIEILPGSQYEIEIRAASVAVVELVKVEVKNKFLSIEIDWVLWGEGEQTINEMKPAHCTITHFY